MQNPNCDDEPQAALLDVPGLGPVPTLHEDAHGVVIDKPPGGTMAAASPRPVRQPGSTDPSQPTGVTPLPYTCLAPIHHLDPEASGALWLSKTKGFLESARRLLGAEPERGLLLQYLAVVGEKPRHRRWECRLKIHPDPRRAGRFLTDTQRGRHASTEFEVLAHGDGLALILATTSSDLPHQIRVHLAAAGLPILGDSLYGFGRDLPRGGQRRRTVERTFRDDAGKAMSSARTPLALRCVEIAFRHPMTGVSVTAQAAVDEFLASFGFDAESGDSERGDDAAEP